MVVSRDTATCAETTYTDGGVIVGHWNDSIDYQIQRQRPDFLVMSRSYYRRESGVQLDLDKIEMNTSFLDAAFGFRVMKKLTLICAWSRVAVEDLPLKVIARKPLIRNILYSKMK